jgi:hypothetical protein
MTDYNPIIRIDDIRLAGYCASGARRWFEQHGLDFRDFLKNGIRADAFTAAGDHLAALVVERKRAREGSDGR